MPSNCGSFAGFGIGLPLASTPLPVRRAKRDGQKIFSGHAIQHKEVAISTRLRQQLARLSIKRCIDQNRSLHRIPIVRIMRRCLKVPRNLPVSAFSARMEQVYKLAPARPAPANTG